MQHVSFLDKSIARIFHGVHVDFASSLEEALGRVLMQPTVSVISLGESTPEAYQRHQYQPIYSISFSAQGLLAGVIECSQELAAMLVDQLLGCHGELIRQQRQLSEIEIELVRDSLVPLLTPYPAAWSKHATFKAKSDGTPTDYLVGEPLFVATYAVTTAEGTGNISYILRLSSWRDLCAKLNQPKREIPVTAPTNNGLLDTIGECMLSARALLGYTHISVKELLGLRVGDIICLDRDPDAPLEIRISNRPKLLGKVRIERGQYVITVDSGVSKGVSDGSK
ncbi:MAG TPA: FliM/FliN family flagellar motor switch protein [Armatimonadota bacterium]|nr:FliM/FliN family flagellar motor switch protein [Armatimonadota bacterium]